MSTRDISGLSKVNFDLCVIGGGINGAALANVASATGAKVLLVDKNDWASGTSSKSTKLLHGGIRYLETLEFDLVQESLKERFIQWKSAPHLVKPLRFIVPVYRNQGRPFWVWRFGVWLYDLLSGQYMFGGHTRLSKDEMVGMVPGIKQDGLVGGVSYFDAQMDDARLCLENVLMARSRGAVTLNHCEAVQILKDNGRAVGVRLKDSFAKTHTDVKAQNVVVTAGPWADGLRIKDNPKVKARLRPTKGVHIIYRGPLGQDAYLLQNTDDGRIFFMIPYKGNTLIGTTDTDYAGSPDDIKVEEKDIDYLLAGAQNAFPSKDFSRAGIITSFAGLRPLVSDYGTPSSISRKHVIERNFSGVHFVMGGKYTTYRAIALDVLNKAMPQFARKFPSNEAFLLYGSGSVKDDAGVVAGRYGVSAQTVRYLMSVYGARYEGVLKLILDDASLKAPLCICSMAIRAQVAYAIEVETAMTSDDIYERRLGLSYNDCASGQCRKVIDEMIKNSRGV